MRGQDYIMIFLQMELSLQNDRLKDLLKFPKEDQDYAWSNLKTNTENKVKYMTRLIDELQGRMADVERQYAILHTKEHR